MFADFVSSRLGVVLALIDLVLLSFALKTEPDCLGV